MKHYSLFFQGFNNPIEWVNIWSKTYYYKDEEKYNKNIHKPFESREAFMKLFEWKNGTGDNISDKKKVSIESIYKKIDNLRSLKENFQWDIFEKEFSPDKNATIWKIFLLHLTNPIEFPIFDQHVHRAYIFITTGVITDISQINSGIYRVYKTEYRPWFNSLKEEFNLDPKRMDEALFSFGRFLKKIEKYQSAVLIKDNDLH